MKIVLCPLCGSTARKYHRDKTREYFQCDQCRLVFVEAGAFLSLEDEKSRYDLHQNSNDDAGYREFLSRMLDPMVKRISPGCAGLDFGCGPGPTLSVMFEEQGYPVALYDPFYAPDESVLATEYDFVIGTEVVEHFRDPGRSLDKMWGCVRPGGYLGVMTKLVIDEEAFENWHYKNDDTHICFFSTETFAWLAQQWATAPVFVGADVVIFQKQRAGQRV